MTLNNSLLECVDQFGDKLDQLGQSEVTSPVDEGGDRSRIIGELSQGNRESEMHKHQIIPMNQHISYINH
jgi:hypothetical protein